MKRSRRHRCESTRARGSNESSLRDDPKARSGDPEGDRSAIIRRDRAISRKSATESLRVGLLSSRSHKGGTQRDRDRASWQSRGPSGERNDRSPRIARRTRCTRELSYVAVSRVEQRNGGVEKTY
jgi:hypothetical protein